MYHNRSDRVHNRKNSKDADFPTCETLKTQDFPRFPQRFFKWMKIKSKNRAAQKSETLQPDDF